MSYTYTGNPSTVLLDEARFLLMDRGDADTGLGGDNRINCIVDDETYTYYLTKFPSSVYRACIYILDSVISLANQSTSEGGQYKILLEQKTGQLTEKYGNKGSDVFLLLDRLKDSLREQDLEFGGLEFWVGGIDREEVDEEIHDATTIGSDGILQYDKHDWLP